MLNGNSGERGRLSTVSGHASVLRVLRWSLVLSPAFGAYIHSLNWTTLNEPERARADRVWFLGSLLMTAVYALLPLAGVGPQAVRYLALLYLVIWYFTAGRSQARYVKERYGKDYPRRPWGKPLLITIGLYLAAIVLLFVVVMTVVTVARLVER